MHQNRILIIKPSSIGDIFHVFPGLDSFQQQYPNCEVHWLVDEKFKSAVSLYGSDIIIHSLDRRIAKSLSGLLGEWVYRYFLKDLSSMGFDYVLDLSFRASDIKSIKHLRVPVFGLDNHWLKQLKGEVLITSSDVSKLYDQAIELPKSWNEIEFKTLPYVQLYEAILSQLGRHIFGKAQYKTVDTNEKNGLVKHFNRSNSIPSGDYALFFHSSSGKVKNWKLEYWHKLAELLGKKGMKIYLPWGSIAEKKRCEFIASSHASCHVLPKLDLTDVAKLIQFSKCIVGCDTGFTHLASLYNKPTIRIWGPISLNAGVSSHYSRDLLPSIECAPCGNTNSCELMGSQVKIEPPCYEEMTPERVIDLLEEFIN